MARKRITYVEPTVENIERGLVTISRIIALYGEAYLPFLFALENALVEAKAREAALARAAAYAMHDAPKAIPG